MEPFAIRVSHTRAAILATALLALAPVAMAQGSGITREVRTLSEPFDSVRVSAGVMVQLVQSDATGVDLEADPRLLAHIRTAVRDHVLEIGAEGSDIRLPAKSPAARVTVRAPSLKHLVTEANGAVQSEKWNNPVPLDVTVLGLADLHLHDLSAPKISVVAAGSGVVRLDGQVMDQEVKMSGAAHYDAAQLKTSSTSVQLSGAGDAVVWATQSLAASVAGTGTIDYYGDPVSACSVAGTGAIHSLGAAP